MQKTIVLLVIACIFAIIGIALISSVQGVDASNPNCPTDTPTPTDTEVPSATPTATSTDTPTNTPTSTPTPTATETEVPTSTFTPTPTDTDTPTVTPTNDPITPTPTATETQPTQAPTDTPTQTATPTATQPETPTPTATQPTPTQTSNPTETPTMTPTETPRPPIPAVALSMRNYQGAALGTIFMDNHSYQLFQGVNDSSGALALPSAERGAAIYGNTIWVHRAWNTGWLHLKVGDFVMVTIDEASATYEVVKSESLPYGVYPKSGEFYIATCMSSDGEHWTNVELFTLRILRIRDKVK